jgi:hypothetical protein
MRLLADPGSASPGCRSQAGASKSSPQYGKFLCIFKAAMQHLVQAIWPTAVAFRLQNRIVAFLKLSKQEESGIERSLDAA